MSSNVAERFKESLGEYFPSLIRRLHEGEDTYEAIADATRSIDDGAISWAKLNQTLHRCSEAGMSEGFFRYYFLEVPPKHPYPVDSVFKTGPFRPPKEADEILSLDQLRWGLQRFIYDAMLYWGNFRQAYRELRNLSINQLEELYSSLRIEEGRMIRRGGVKGPTPIPRDNRYLISEQACKTYEPASSLDQTHHVQLALNAFRSLKLKNRDVTPSLLKDRTRELAEGAGQRDLFDLMYEDATVTLNTEAEVLALYSGQWEAFKDARKVALDNTRIYLSSCNDLDVYVATSMRIRQDFREMAAMCEQIFKSKALSKYNLRYFDPTLSATKHHEDKGIIECLMVKTAKVLLYFSQHKESLGKISEYAMALSLGKPVIVLCPDDDRGRELYRFYREAHPLMRLVQFESGIANGAMVTHKMKDVVELLERIFSNRMEYDLGLKPGTDAYYLLKERLTGTTIRVITDDRLLTETFWNNWHGIE